MKVYVNVVDIYTKKLGLSSSNQEKTFQYTVHLYVEPIHLIAVDEAPMMLISKKHENSSKLEKKNLAGNFSRKNFQKDP